MAAWTALYLSDYILTVYCARLYEKRGRETIVYGGSYELNPAFQKDVDSGRWLSPRFILLLLASCGFLAIIWNQSRRPPAWPAGYEFTLGAMLLLELAVHVRHVRNVVLFRFGLGSHGVRGRIEYARHLLYDMSAAELVAFGVMFAVAFLASGGPFLLGGAASCAVTGFGHYRMARRQPRAGSH
jgi:hypothetical protein